MRLNNKDVVEIRLNGAVVWPMAFEYRLTSVRLRYSSSDQIIYASGSNYAYLIANVERYRGGVYVDTLPDVELEAVKSSGEGFSADGSHFKAANRQNIPGQERPGVFYGKYEDQTTSLYTVTQEANEEIISYGQKTPTGNETRVTQYRNKILSISSDKYTQSPCSAAGNVRYENILTYGVQEEQRDEINTEYNQEVYHDWTSGYPRSTTYTTNWETTYTSWVWTTVSSGDYTVTGSADGFDRSGTNVRIYSRSTDPGSQRSCTYTISYKGSSKSVTIYQEANIESLKTEYSHSCDWVPSSIPAGGGYYYVSYSIYRYQWYEYTSGAQTSKVRYSDTQSVYLKVGSGSYQYQGEASADGSIQVWINANSSSSARTVTVSIGDASDSIMQSGQAEVYTMDLWRGSEHITSGSTVTAGGYTFSIEDRGSNLRGYTISKVSGTQISWSTSGNIITFDDIDQSTDCTIKISESSSGQSVQFRILG